MQKKEIYCRKNFTPKVTVLMAVYNREKYVREAVDSILNQTFKDFEFIVVNDGSTDRTKKILEGYTDKRIKIINIEENLGPAEARNIGLKNIKGEYIAIMDSDDISLPGRLAKQVRCMERRPEIGVLGAAEEIIDSNGALIGINRFPAEPGFIKWSIMLGGWCCSHPTVMMQHSLIKRLSGYSMVSPPAEDYELWTRALFYTQFANMPDILLRRRIWEGNVSFINAKTQQKIILDAMHRVIIKVLGKRVARNAVARLFLLERTILLDGHQIEADIGRKITAHCAKLVRNISLCNFQQVMSVAELIRKLYNAYLNTYRLNYEEKKQVTLHVLKRLYILSKIAKKLSIPDKKVSSLFKV